MFAAATKSVINSSTLRYHQLIFTLITTALMITVFGQSRWQNVTNFHPYCVRLYRTCVEASSGANGATFDVAVEICGNKMAICTFSDTLQWPWSTIDGLRLGGPALPRERDPSRLTTYRSALISPINSVSIPWQNLTAFLPDCVAEFRRCVNFRDWNDQIIGICGNGMAVCTERQGIWPYGNDTSVYWQQSYDNATLQRYRAVIPTPGSVSNNRFDWRVLTVFLPICQNMMAQCVLASGGQTNDDAVNICGNQMAICTSENVFWPFTHFATAAYIEPYESRWLRYANIINPISLWQDVTRFSSFCTNRFFECVYSSNNSAENVVVKTCGNRMSVCTFNNNIWPNASEVSTAEESYISRLSIYYAMFGNKFHPTPSYSTFPSVIIPLYPFSHHTFRNCLATGRFGPTLSQCRTAYAAQSWAQDSRYFNMTTQGIQLWTVPETGSYRITSVGATGGGSGGRGARVEGTFNLLRGQVLAIIVGQRGTDDPKCSCCLGSGGGGSFVWNTESTIEPLIVAGGGGGSANGMGGNHGQNSAAGTSHVQSNAGTGGMGGIPGGSGWKSNGGTGFDGNNIDTFRPLEGGWGGRMGTNQIGGDGGFGGGASSSMSTSFCNGNGGGAGGYSGGGGPLQGTGTPGGGGGSYNSGLNFSQSSMSGRDQVWEVGHGLVSIERWATQFQRTLR